MEHGNVKDFRSFFGLFSGCLRVIAYDTGKVVDYIIVKSKFCKGCRH